MTFSLIAGLFLLVVIVASTVNGQSSNTTCNFQLTFPNSSYPTLGEILTGILSYDNAANPIVGYSGYPFGHNLLSFTGTRTVWQATPGSPTKYNITSTSTILGLVPVANYTFFANNSAGFPVLQFGAQLFVPNATLPNGAPVFLFWDNYIYPSGVADLMDPSGLLAILNSAQVGSVNVPPVGNVYTVYSNNGVPAQGSDLTDDVDFVHAGGPGVDTSGFFGVLNLTNCRSSARVVGDPLLRGFLGQTFQVHGVDGLIYSLLSSPSLQINARFKFLASGSCPSSLSSHRPSILCWSHAGSYLSEISIQTAQGSRLRLVAGSASTGFAMLEGSILKEDAWSAVVNVGGYEMKVHNSDGFLNVAELSVLDWNYVVEVDQPHGLLGQTWKRTNSKIGKGVSGVSDVIEGEVDDYSMTTDSIWAHDDIFNKFHPVEASEQ